MSRTTGNNYSGPQYLFSTKDDGCRLPALSRPVAAPVVPHEHRHCPGCGVRLWPGTDACPNHAQKG